MIPLLIPDLPLADELLPWLKQIDSNKWYSNFGPLVQEFEAQLSTIIHSPLVSVNSGTSALELSLGALNLPAQTKVLLPGFTFPATATAVKALGLQPLFSDIDPDSWQLTPAIARQVLAHQDYDVAIPVTTFGHPQPADEWDQFFLDTGVTVLIDAASSFAQQSTGDHCIAAFSLHATKLFGIGEGGLVACRDTEFIKQVKKLSNFGFEQSVITQAGSNGKLSEYHAAAGLAQLVRWPEIKQRREAVWRLYRQYIDPHLLQAMPKHHIPSVLSVKIHSERNNARVMTEVTDYFHKQGIQTRRWYYPAVHQHPAFRECLNFAPQESSHLPVTENLSLLGLPFHSSLTEDDIVSICHHLNICTHQFT